MGQAKVFALALVFVFVFVFCFCLCLCLCLGCHRMRSLRIAGRGGEGIGNRNSQGNGEQGRRALGRQTVSRDKLRGRRCVNGEGLGRVSHPIAKGLAGCCTTKTSSVICSAGSANATFPIGEGLGNDLFPRRGLWGTLSTSLRSATSPRACRPHLAENSTLCRFPGARCHCGGEAWNAAATIPVP